MILHFHARIVGIYSMYSQNDAHKLQNMSTPNFTWRLEAWQVDETIIFRMFRISEILLLFNLSWPSDAIQRHGSGSTLAQVMACCLTAPSHYQNQWWLIIGGVSWHSLGANSLEKLSDIYPGYEFEYYKFKSTAASPRDQWVKMCTHIQGSMAA